jgi:hypothetical protein
VYKVLKKIEERSVLKIIANIRHASLDWFVVRAMRKKLKLRSDGDDSGSRE